MKEEISQLLGSGKYAHCIGVNAFDEVINEIKGAMNDKDLPHNILQIVRLLKDNEKKEVGKYIWDSGKENRLQRVYTLFQKLIDLPKHKEYKKEDISEPTIFSTFFTTNETKKFFGLDYVFKQMTEGIQSRANFTHRLEVDEKTRQFFFCTLYGSGSGKTTFNYALCRAAMKGELGEFFGIETELYKQFSKKVCSIQVQFNDKYEYNLRERIDLDTDISVRMFHSFFFKNFPLRYFKNFYKDYWPFLPTNIENMIELCYVFWSDKVLKENILVHNKELNYKSLNQVPYVFVTYDEIRNVVGGKGIKTVVSDINQSIENMDVTKSQSDLYCNNKYIPLKLLNVFTALEPDQISPKEDIKLSKNSSRRIAWPLFDDLLKYIDEILAGFNFDKKKDQLSRFVVSLALHWTNNARDMECVIHKCWEIFNERKEIVGKNLFKIMEKVREENIPPLFKETDAWKFIPLVLCGFSVSPQFFVSKEFKIAKLFYENILCPYPLSPFSYSKLLLEETLVECSTSKFVLFDFYQSCAKNSGQNQYYSNLLRSTMETEPNDQAMGNEFFDKYFGHFLLLNLSCWDSVLNDNSFKGIKEFTTDNTANKILSTYFDDKLLPLSQLFRNSAESYSQGKTIEDISILMGEKWEIDYFDMNKSTIMKPYRIYFPTQKNQKGFDIVICFLNQRKETSLIFIQCKLIEDDTYNKKVIPLDEKEYSKSIVNSLAVSHLLQQNNKNIKSQNCYYLIFTQKPINNFENWKTEIEILKNSYKQQSKKNDCIYAIEEKTEKGKKGEYKFGGIFKIEDNIALKKTAICLGPIFSIFFVRTNETKAIVNEKGVRNFAVACSDCNKTWVFSTNTEICGCKDKKRKVMELKVDIEPKIKATKTKVKKPKIESITPDKKDKVSLEDILKLNSI
eukprot:TRINITY_DN11931_c0_g1_i1.p1 TRINITY_DN11931_c0_g1~~TRINITY_DN11931_c0_g1_i1.p1  ORF type:complete len:1055 (-),score=221.88 TRINITY_DN11931_c0_g1_i1:31-2745(-)